MKRSPIFITEREWFESTSLRNPILSVDHKLEQFYPNFYRVSYDVKLLATKAATEEKKCFPVYNNYRERYGVDDIHALDAAIMDRDARYVFLNGFNQEQFLHIAPGLRDTTEVIYLFKCPKIRDLSILAQFSKLKCVHIYWNNSLESLWDMAGNKELKVLSFTAISKLCNIEALKQSHAEYINFDSSDSNGRTKNMLFDASVFDQMPCLKHLSLSYSDCTMDY